MADAFNIILLLLPSTLCTQNRFDLTVNMFSR